VPSVLSAFSVLNPDLLSAFLCVLCVSAVLPGFSPCPAACAQTVKVTVTALDAPLAAVKVTVPL